MPNPQILLNFSGFDALWIYYNGTIFQPVAYLSSISEPLFQDKSPPQAEFFEISRHLF